MVSFLDVAKVAHRTVPVRGVEMPIYGISGRGIVLLLDRFPEIRAKWGEKKTTTNGSGEATAAESTKLSDLFTLDDLKELGPRVLHAIMAAGIGKPGDPAEEEAAADISAGEQGEILIAIMEATFPRGLAPFASKLREFGLPALADSLTSLLKLQQLDIGKDPDTTSPLPSNGSSTTDTLTPGTTPPGK